MTIRFTIYSERPKRLSFPDRASFFAKLGELKNADGIYRVFLNDVSQPVRYCTMKELTDLICGACDTDDPLPLYGLVWLGLNEGVVMLKNETVGCTSLCCQIGNSEQGAFYFIDTDTKEELYEKHSQFDVVSMITDCIENPEEHGLSEEEVAVYIAALKETEEKKCGKRPYRGWKEL